MRAFIHAFLSIKRNFIRSIMLCVLFSLVFTLIFVCVITLNSIDEAKRSIRNEIGGIVEMYADGRSIEAAEKKGIVVEEEEYMLPEKLAEEIAKDSLVVGYSMIVLHSEAMGERRIEIQGVSSMEPIQFYTGDFGLEDEGRFFNEDEIKEASQVVIVSNDFSIMNQVKVGDYIDIINSNDYYYKNGLIEKEGSIDLSLYPEPTPEQYQIVGIYSTKEKSQTDICFMPFLTAQRFYAYKEETIIHGIYYVINDPLLVDTFIERNSVKIPNKYIILDGSSDQYNTLIRPFESIRKVFDVLIIGFLVAGMGIIFAVIQLHIRGRYLEVGLLIAMGETKVNIMIQMITELLIIGALSFVIALGVTQIGNTFVRDLIVSEHIVTQKSSSDMDVLAIMTENRDSLFKREISIEDVANKFRLQIENDEWTMLIMVYLMGFLLATLIPLRAIIWLKPNKILRN